MALVVGNGAYKTAPLSNSVNDAADMALALQGLGFEVTALQDANLRQMREATRRFEQAALTADVALIFFAGHGIEARGRNYMVPVDADIAREYELEDQAYDAGQWLAMLEGARAGNHRPVLPCRRAGRQTVRGDRRVAWRRRSCRPRETPS